jgi:hypothetical protein
MKRNTLIFTAALVLLLSVACRPRTATLTPPPTPELLPTPTLIATPAPETPADPAPGVQIIGEDVTVVASGFSGTFEGTLTSDSGSSAPASLTLLQDGLTVSGTINVGQGLVVDGGNCGQTTVPAGNVSANGQLDPATPNRLDAGSMFNVQGLAIELRLVGDLSADGQTLTAQATIDLPLLCGRDPVISGTFMRR